MTTCEVDLSKSDSLIEDIQKIFKPPSVDASINPRFSKSSSKSSYYGTEFKSKDISNSNSKIDEIDSRNFKGWKKPKPNSHEYCDSCSTYEGDRLVCDRCPASFHLVCLDPPVDVEDAPVGVWYCNRCTAIMKEEDDKYSNASNNSNNKTEYDDNHSNGICNVANKRSESSISSEITAEMSEEIPSKKLKLGLQNDVRPLSALQNVIDVLQCLNPKEFELPRNLIPSIKLPNTFKNSIEMKNKTVITLENGYIPKPVVTCFECSKTCFYGTLVQCDYCPCYYHLDCLDPPLIQLPSRVERWMCPNHIEQVIDKSGKIETIRLSERIANYDRIKNDLDKVNEMDIINSFSAGSGFRFGMEYNKESSENIRINVPDAVKRMYKNAKGLKSSDGKVTFTTEQSLLLQSIFEATRNSNDIDLNQKTAQEILETTLESLKLLVSTNKLDLNVNKSENEVISNRCLRVKPGNGKIKCRAVLLPIDKDGTTKNSDAIRITYRNFTIGSGEDSDCMITGCKYVSPNHASICYIDNHFCYELLNYSRYGTIVDRLLYYNDLTQKDTQKSIITSQNIKDIRNLLQMNGKNNTKQKLFNNNKFNKPSLMNFPRDSDKSIGTCTCFDLGYGTNALNNCDENGWENSAPLKFGSIIEIGCQKFIFTSLQDLNSPSNILSGTLDQTQNDSSDQHNISNNTSNISAADLDENILATSSKVTVHKTNNIHLKPTNIIRHKDDNEYELDDDDEEEEDAGDDGDDEREDITRSYKYTATTPIATTTIPTPANISCIKYSQSGFLLKSTNSNIKENIHDDIDDDEEDDDDDLDIDADENDDDKL